MDISKLVQAGVGVVVGVIMLKIADVINATTTYNQTLTSTVMTYVPTLFAVGILIGSVAWALYGLRDA
jgi:hypothetical protein